MRRRRGFTLIEMLIALALLGLLIALSVPAFTGARQKQGLRVVAEQLADDLSLARSMARSRNIPTGVRFISPHCYEIEQGWARPLQRIRRVDLSHENPCPTFFAGYWETANGHPVTAENTLNLANELAPTEWLDIPADVPRYTSGDPNGAPEVMGEWAAGDAGPCFIFWPNGFVKTIAGVNATNEVMFLPRYDNCFHVVVTNQARVEAVPSPAPDRPVEQLGWVGKATFTVLLDLAGVPSVVPGVPFARFRASSNRGRAFEGPAPRMSPPSQAAPTFRSGSNLIVVDGGADQVISGGQTVQLVANVDATEGQPAMVCEWTAEKGTLSADNMLATQWTAPQEPGVFTIHVKVSTPGGPWSVEASTNLTVSVTDEEIICDVGHGRLLVFTPDGSRLREVTPPSFTQLNSPSWSPDGTRIVFSGHPTNSADAQDKHAQLWVMNADGSGLQRLSDDSAVLGGAAGDKLAPVWSPDGTQIAYTQSMGFTQPSPSPGNTAMVNGPSDVYTINGDGTNPEALTQGQLTGGTAATCPTWAPDGQYVYYQRARPGPDSGFPCAIERYNIKLGHDEMVAQDNREDYVMPAYWPGHGLLYGSIAPQVLHDMLPGPQDLPFPTAADMTQGYNGAWAPAASAYKNGVVFVRDGRPWRASADASNRAVPIELNELEDVHFSPEAWTVHPH